MRKKIILDTKNKKGITLVSLVVTIIVLLILAGITINLIIGEDGIIRRAQEAGKNYIDAAESEKLQLGVFTNEMDNIIGGTISSGREPYNSEFRKNVVEAIKKAGVTTTENDTDETIVANIGKILQEATKDATATADNISQGKTAWVNGELITGNGADNDTSYNKGAEEVASAKQIKLTNLQCSNNRADQAERYDLTIDISQYKKMSVVGGGYSGSQASMQCVIYLDGETYSTSLNPSFSNIDISNNSTFRLYLYCYTGIGSGYITINSITFE